MRALTGTLATLVVLVASGMPVLASDVNTHYRWEDKRGNPVFSDRPPPKGVDYRVESTRSTYVREVDADEGAVPLETESTVGNEFEQKLKRQQESRKNPALCEKARKNLETLDIPQRIRLRDENGEYRYVEQDEREELRQRARRNIEVYCD